MTIDPNNRQNETIDIIINRPPEQLEASLTILFEQIENLNEPRLLYKKKLINGGVKVTKSSVRKLRIRYKLYRAKLRRETFFVIHEELFDIFKTPKGKNEQI